MMDEPLARLSVDRSELASALKRIARLCKPRPIEEVVFSFEDDALRIDCRGGTERAIAAGSWPGRARVKWSDLQPAASNLPAANPLVLCVSEGLLALQRYKLACAWLPGQAIACQLPLILLPLDPSPREILSLRYRFAESDLAQSGHLPALLEAEARLETQVRNAWRSCLGEHGVTLDEVHELVDRALRRSVSESDDV